MKDGNVKIFIGRDGGSNDKVVIVDYFNANYDVILLEKK